MTIVGRTFVSHFADGAINYDIWNNIQYMKSDEACFTTQRSGRLGGSNDGSPPRGYNVFWWLNFQYIIRALHKPQPFKLMIKYNVSSEKWRGFLTTRKTRLIASRLDGEMGEKRNSLEKAFFTAWPFAFLLQLTAVCIVWCIDCETEKKL